MFGDGESSPEVGPREDDAAGYERSKIAFPYFDLSECIKLAAAISANVGAGECTDDQLAPWLDLSPKSSGYRSRVSAARLFGLIEAGSEYDHRLSNLGLEVLDANHSRAAKAKAFLNVPLFKKVYEDWRAQQLPPPAALERAFVNFGVAQKQTARARQTLERSAAEAGYFEQGRDRLVKPGIKEDLKQKGDDQANHGGGSGGSGSGGSRGGPGLEKLDPVIRGLIEKLPPPNSVWPETDRKLWLTILEGSFKLVYKDAPEAPAGSEKDEGFRET